MAKRKKNEPEDEYYLDRVMNTGTAIIRVYRPIITEEERERRMKLIHDAFADLAKSVYQQRREAERKQFNKANPKNEN